MESAHLLRKGDALIVLDVQRDFCPGGALAVANGHDVVPILNEWVAAAGRLGLPIYASRDWHPVGHPSFREEGGPWPAHCVQDTPGAEDHPALRLPSRTIRITKGTRLDRDQCSAFDETGLAAHLRARGVRRVGIGGLALDVCVRATALDARREGFEVFLIPNGARAIDPDAGQRTIRELAAIGVLVDAGAQPEAHR